MKAPLLIFCSLICLNARGQSNDTALILTLKRSIWFYPGTQIDKSKRVTIGANNAIWYKRIEGDVMYQAKHLNRSGYVQSDQVTDEFQNYLVNALIKEDLGIQTTTSMQAQADENIDMIRSAGTKIRNGANTWILGTFIAVVGTGAGLYVANLDNIENPKIGYWIAGGSGVIGLAIQIGGMANISAGGGMLRN